MEPRAAAVDHEIGYRGRRRAGCQSDVLADSRKIGIFAVRGRSESRGFSKKNTRHGMVLDYFVDIHLSFRMGRLGGNKQEGC